MKRSISMNKKIYTLLSFIVLLSFMLVACGAAQPAPAAAATEAPATEWPAWAVATCNNGKGTVVINQKTVDCGEVLNGATPNNLPAAQAPDAAEPAKPADTSSAGNAAPANSNSSASGNCSPAVGNLDNMLKTKIELASTGTWFHRVFNERLFNQANNWGGADSWFVTLALGSNSGGSWTSHSNPGQIVYRGTNTHLTWCLGVLTTAQWKEQFMGSGNTPAAINVRIAPDSPVTVTTASGKTVVQNTSDMGDITIVLPDSGVITISVDYTTAAPTHESLVWWGPYDRSENINTIDAR